MALFPADTQGQAIEAWVQRYNGLDNGSDYAGGMAVDTTGNVYVTGASYDSSEGYPKCVTLAYSSAGAPLWTNVYAAPGYIGTLGNALAVDSSGNVYVTGQSVDSGYSSYCITLKYSSAGVPLWTKVYPASGNAGWALAPDPSGNVMVTTRSGVTIKYSSAGTVLWTRTYSDDSGTSPVAMAVDFSGNVVVAGDTGGWATMDWATRKYSSTGAVLWTKTYNGPISSADEPTAVAVDREGNVVVTGGTSANYGSDYATVKYSSAGVPLWTNLYNGPGNDNDGAQAVAVDTRGDVVVTGTAVGAGTSVDYATIKYSSAGVPLWTNRYNGPGGFAGPGRGMDRATALALDGQGNVFVTGTSEDASGMYWDYATIAYSSAGMPLWTNRYNGPGNKREEPRAVVVDANGSVYVAGFSEALGSSEDPSPQNYDFAIVKYVTPPIITRQPLSRTNAVGTTVGFDVEVVGTLPLSFQWRMNGRDLAEGGKYSGVNTTNLLIADAQLADAGDYTVVVTNEWGSATSVLAHLTVVTPPNAGKLTNFKYSLEAGFSFVFRDATVGQPYRIQRSASMESDWADWQSFTFSEPILFTDMGATGAERRFYRAVSP